MNRLKNYLNKLTATHRHLNKNSTRLDSDSQRCYLILR